MDIGLFSTRRPLPTRFSWHRWAQCQHSGSPAPQQLRAILCPAQREVLRGPGQRIGSRTQANQPRYAHGIGEERTKCQLWQRAVLRRRACGGFVHGRPFRPGRRFRWHVRGNGIAGKHGFAPALWWHNSPPRPARRHRGRNCWRRRPCEVVRRQQQTQEPLAGPVRRARGVVRLQNAGVAAMPA